MSRDFCVHTWPCSYYLELEKRWVPGKLWLTSLSLKFLTDKTGDFLVSFSLADIIEIKKEASHFIFSSVTNLEKGHVKHWFSSLQPNRNVVFHIIEHFWRELLLSQPGGAVEASSSRMTKGKELTGLMACSQKRLEDAARVLHYQGEQLDSITSSLDNMESDLDVADRFEREDVDDIKVHTHYEVSIRQRFIGKPDITFRLISAKMPEVVPILEMQFSKKIEFLEDALMLRSTGTSSPAAKGYSVWQAASRPVDCARHREPSSGNQEGRLLQLQMSEPLISEEDTQELRQIKNRSFVQQPLHYFL